MWRVADPRRVEPLFDVITHKWMHVAHTFDSPLEVAITDNLGFGGHNAALVFKRYTGEGKTRQPADDEVLKVKSWYDAGERL